MSSDIRRAEEEGAVDLSLQLRDLAGSRGGGGGGAPRPAEQRRKRPSI